MIKPDEWDGFFKKLAERCNISEACEVSGISRAVVYQHIEKNDPEWTKRFEHAKAEMKDRLDRELFRRGHDGWDEPVFGRVAKDTDGQIGTVRKYSDPLLILLVKAHMPEKYKDKVTAELSGPGGGPVQTEVRVIAVPAIPENSPE